MSEKISRFSNTEKIVIGLATVFLIGGAVIWVTDFPIGSYLLGLTGGASQKEVGKLERANGGIRREQATEADFREISTTTPLFNEDTLVTAPETSATLRLNDGSTLDMAPGTMIRLSFEDNLSLKGVNRTVNVEVVKGSVTGSSADPDKNKIILKGAGKTMQLDKNGQTLQVSAPVPPKPAYTPPPKPSPTPTPSPTPSPSPSPTESPVVRRKTQMMFPAEGTHLKVRDGSPKAEVPIDFAWTVSPPPKEVQFEVIREGGKKPVVVFRKKVKAASTQMKLPLTLKIPGKYRWVIEDASEMEVDSKSNTKDLRRYGRANFVIDPDFKSIAVEAPLVGGKAVTSNAMQDALVKNFDIMLSWKQFDDIQDYIVSFFVQEDSSKPALQQLITGTNYSMNKNKIFAGKVYYEVSAQLPNGFVVHSPRSPFIFEFAPPMPVFPADKTQISVKDLKAKENRILFTWQKTNFTDSYNISISSDPAFNTVLITRTTRENFFVLKSPRLGSYYWRLESNAGTLKSGPSAPAQVDIIP
jgi:hypothetical protein